MSSWTYQHPEGHEPAGCKGPKGVELSLGACEASVDITVRYPGGIVLRRPTGEVQREDVIASIHLPRERVLEAVEMLLRYGGVEQEEAIAYLSEQQAERERPAEVGPAAAREQPGELPGFVGSVASGREDVSENVDRHLGDGFGR